LGFVYLARPRASPVNIIILIATYNNRVFSSHLTTISSGASEVHVIEVVKVGELAGEETRQWLSKINSTVNFA
jgi:hypothetical protein